MSDIRELRDLFDRAVRGARQRARIPARLGYQDSSGTWRFDVPGWPDYVYVRIGRDEETTTLHKALNHAVGLIPDLPVWVERTAEGPLAIVGVRAVEFQTFAGGTRTGATVAPHTHEPGSGMVDPVSTRRIRAGLVRAYDAGSGYGLSVYVEAFSYRYGGADRYWPGGTVDLTTYLPGTGEHRWAKVCLDPTDNSIVVVPGPALSTNVTLTEAMLREIAAEAYVPLAGVRLRGDTTSINSETFFVDLRPWWVNAGGGGGSTWYWSVDAPPLVTSSLDDEFGDGTVTGWTEYDESGLQTVTETGGELVLSQTAQTAARLTGVYKTLPSGDCTIAAKVKVNLDSNADLLLAGLALFENAATYTGRALVVGLFRTSNVWRIGYVIYNDSNDGHSMGWDSYGYDWSAGDYVYLRLRRSGSTYYLDYGSDGKTWATMELTVPFTPGHVGLALLNEGASATFTLNAAFFRYRAVADPADAFVYGAPAFDVVTSFTGLTDTPDTYSGQGGKLVAVKTDESGLEFISGLTVKEVDGTPTVSGVTTIRVSNGTLTDDGGGQVTIATGGGGGGASVSVYGEVVLFDVTLSSDGVFDFQNIPQDYDHLRVYAFLRRAGTTAAARVYLNNDTTDSNYRVTAHRSGSNHTSSTADNAGLLNTPNSSYYANIWCMAIIDILYYRTTSYKVLYAHMLQFDFSSGPSFNWNDYYTNSMVYKGSTGAITRLTITETTGWLAGSRCVVTGIGTLQLLRAS